MGKNANATCKAGFEQAMASLVDPLTARKEYLVYFNPGEAAIGQSANDVIYDAALFIRDNGLKTYKIILSGAADQVQAVKERLVEIGYAQDFIAVDETGSVSQDSVSIAVKYKPVIEDQSEI